MIIEGWKYYNHAAVPTCAPHKNPNLKPIIDGSIWKISGGVPLIARWTSNWDSMEATSFWYCIKDDPYDITQLKSKRRYEINKGKKNFTVRRINPVLYAQEIYNVAIKAFAAYPKEYRPIIDKFEFIREIEDSWGNYDVFGAFDSDQLLCGYAYLIVDNEHADFSVLKSDPSFEKKGINAALVDGILTAYNSLLYDGGFYICDGARAIRHATHFQDYLEKYFGFRKCYCHLHIRYRWFIKLGIVILSPFETILLNFNNSSLMYNIISLIEMNKLIND